MGGLIGVFPFFFCREFPLFSEEEDDGQK